MMSKKIGKIFIIGCIFLALSIILFSYNNYLQKKFEHDSKAIIEILDEKIESNSQKQDSYIDIDNKKYIGKISIPSLNILVPVLNEMNEQNLNLGACKYYENINNEQIIIGAHNFPKYFGMLKYLKTGDRIIFTDINGEEIYYKIEMVENVAEADVSEMIETQYDLTLFTCNNARTTRITVRCNKIL